MMAEELIEIIIDIHEQDSDVANYISRRQIGACKMVHRKSGDVILYLSEKSVALEIKRGQDFDNSLKDGRLHNQICEMYARYDFPILVVEDWHPWVTDEDDEASIKEKVRKHEMTIRTLNRRITTYETPHLEATVDLIEEIARDMLNGKLFVMRRPVVIQEGLTDGMKILCAYPNIKETLAERLLLAYGTAEKALENIDSWTDVHGIGKVKMINIREALREEYK